jgi:hypothetical protein
MNVPKVTIKRGSYDSVPFDISWKHIMGTHADQTPIHFGPHHESHYPDTVNNKYGANVATPQSHLPRGITEDGQGRTTAAADLDFHDKMTLRIPTSVSPALYYKSVLTSRTTFRCYLPRCPYWRHLSVSRL